MSDYDGFATVQDPQDYMNAPAMIIPPDGDSRRSTFSPPPILRAAIDASRNFELLSADEIQAQYAEQNVLQQRISDVISRLDVEVKMREAARSLSRLHRKPSDASMSPSTAAGGSSHSARKRISKIFSGSSGGSGHSDGKDKRQSGQQQQRHSMQAEEEAEISSEKIRHLEQLRFDLSQRKALVDKRIIQHHAAVMARALGGVPLPNHRRLQSGASAMSNLSGSSTPGQRQSWVVADTHGKHMRNTSAVSAHSFGADSSLATVREHMPASTGSSATINSRLEEEVNALAGRVAQAIPGMSPAPQGAIVFISNAFERLLRELADTRNSAEAYHIQAQHSEERIEFLNRELERSGTQSRSVGADSNRLDSSGYSASQEAEVAQLHHEIDAERSTIQQLRTQANKQRAELERTVQSLEEVTRLAVQYETERSDLEQALSLLETKTGTLEEDKMVLLQQRLGATQNSSVLCKEFQRIIGDLMEQHQRELRQLHPKISSVRKTADQHYGYAETPAVSGNARASDTVNENDLVDGGDSLTHYDHDGLSQPGPHSGLSSAQNSRSADDARKELRFNDEFSQSPEPLSVHSAVRKAVPSRGPDNISVPSRKPVASDKFTLGDDSPTNANLSAEKYDAEDTASKLYSGNTDHRPLPAPMDSDISLADSIPGENEEDLSAPRLKRISSEYSADFSEHSRSSSVYPENNSAAQSTASVLPHPHHPNQSQASLARAQDYSFNSNDELL